MHPDLVSMLPHPHRLLPWYTTRSRRYWIGANGLAVSEWMPCECAAEGW